MNVDSFTYRSFELYTTNMFLPLSHIDDTMESIKSTCAFSPLHTSSPRNKSNNNTKEARNSSTPNIRNRSKRDNSNSTTNIFSVPNKLNLRIMTMNCRSIRDKKSEFAALVNYAKPDIIIGTESWLKGIKPGKPPTESAIKSAEIFPENFKVYRNDRGTLGGGVFIAVHSELVSIEQPEAVTECEIEWVKIKLKNSKDLSICPTATSMI